MDSLEIFDNIKLGNVRVIEHLLSTKPSLINITDEKLWTPLHWAASEGEIEVVELLISRGADVNARDLEGETPLFGAVDHSTDVSSILLEAGSDVNTRNYEGKTALHKLAYYGERIESKFLIEHGAKIKVKDNDGRSPLHYAALSGLQEEVVLLISYGAEVNSKDNRDYSPLHMAVTANITQAKLSSYLATIEKLIHYGSDVTAQTSEGKTALELAYYQEIIELLIQHGAENPRKSL